MLLPVYRTGPSGPVHLDYGIGPYPSSAKRHYNVINSEPSLSPATPERPAGRPPPLPARLACAPIPRARHRAAATDQCGSRGQGDQWKRPCPLATPPGASHRLRYDARSLVGPRSGPSSGWRAGKAMSHGVSCWLHQRFAGSRIRGEWFKRTPELTAMIVDVRRGTS